MLIISVLFLQHPAYPERIRHQKSDIKHEWQIGTLGRHEAEDLNVFWADLSNPPSIGTIAAGGFAWKYNGQVIDLLGLNNVAMAHANSLKNKTAPKNHGSFDKSVFLFQAPDIIRLSYLALDSCSGMNEFDKYWYQTSLANIDLDPRFISEYKWTCVWNAKSEIKLVGYMRKDFLERITKDYSLYDVETH